MLRKEEECSTVSTKAGGLHSLGKHRGWQQFSCSGPHSQTRLTLHSCLPQPPAAGTSTPTLPLLHRGSVASSLSPKAVPSEAHDLELPRVQAEGGLPLSHLSLVSLGLCQPCISRHLPQTLRRQEGDAKRGVGPLLHPLEHLSVYAKMASWHHFP